MRKFTLLLVIVILSSLFADFDMNDFQLKFHPGSIVFKPAEGSLNAIEDIAIEYNGSVSKVGKVLDIYVMTFEPAFPAELFTIAAKNNDKAEFDALSNEAEVYIGSILRRLRNENLVEYASVNAIYRQMYIPNDPYAIEGTDLSEDGDAQQFGLYAMNIVEAWDHTMGDPDVLIAVLDSGVDIDHPDLWRSIWVNPGEDIDGDGILYDLDDANGIDDDGNGYVDDLFGYDFSGGNIGLMMGGDDDPLSEDNNPDIHYWGDDGHGEPDPSVGDGLNMLGMSMPALFPADFGVFHGTHVSGIIAGSIDNNYMMAGAAPHCRVMAVRIGHSEGSMFMNDVVSGIEYAVASGADVINMSFGGDMDTISAIIEACQYAYDNNVAIAAAAGNNGNAEPVASPANYPTTFAVGSCNSEGGVSSFSQTGPEIDVVSNGGEVESDGMSQYKTEVIWSLMVGSIGLEVEEPSRGISAGEHASVGEVGTSMATPFVAALMGLVISVNTDIEVEDLFEIMRETAADVDDPGFDNNTGHGWVDFEAAVTYEIAAPAILPVTPSEYIVSSNEEQEITFRYSSDEAIDESTVEISVNGSTYTLDDSELTLDDSENTLVFTPTTEYLEGNIDVEVLGFQNTSGVEAHIYPEYSFITDFTPPEYLGANPSTSVTMRIVPSTITVMVSDDHGIDFGEITVTDDGGTYTMEDGIYIWSNLIYIPTDILDMPEIGDYTLTLTVGDRIGIGEPNYLVRDLTYTIMPEAIKEQLVPNISEISEVYPNPFNSSAKLEVTLREAGDVALDLIDINGKVVKSNSYNLPSGITELIINGENLPSGVYSARVSTETTCDSKEIILIK